MRAHEEIYKLPFRYDKEDQKIFDADGHFALDVRGWGRLQYLPDGENKQDEFGQYVVDCLNGMQLSEFKDKLKKEVEKQNVFFTSTTMSDCVRNDYRKNILKLIDTIK